MELYRRYSSPISPMTIPQDAQNTPLNVIPASQLNHLPEAYSAKKINWSTDENTRERSRTSTFIPPPLSWCPFHVFSTRPQASFLGERNGSVYSHDSVENRIIARQKGLFHDIEEICTNATKKYWLKQSASAMSQPSISHYTALSLRQDSQQGVAKLNNDIWQICETHEDNALMEYIELINDTLFRRTRALPGDHDAATGCSISKEKRRSKSCGRGNGLMEA